MRGLLRLAVLGVMATCILGTMLPAWSSQTTEGQVVTVQENVLYVRTTAGEPMSFAPYFVFNGSSYVAAKPADTVLPALESGEWVKVMWTLDTREGWRRIDGISILRTTSGTTVGKVVSTSTTQLVIRPKDEPGTVTLNPSYVKRENRSVPDPEIARKLASLTKNAVVTVGWAWDQEGRKRITSLVLGTTTSPIKPPSPPMTTK
jgi:hypothetical protein